MGGTADHSAHYEASRISGPNSSRNTGRTVQEFSPAAYYSLPRSEAYPYGYGHYHGHPNAMYGVPIPAPSATYTKAPPGRTANQPTEMVDVGALTTAVQKQPIL